MARSRTGRTLHPARIGRSPRRNLARRAPQAEQRLHFELGIDSFFGASHSIRPDGARHTHSFRVQATFVAEAIDDDGMVVGFREVSDLLETEARKYANAYINDVPPFDVIQPTGENIAAVIFRELSSALQATLLDGPRLVSVTLWENPASYVKVNAA